MLKYLLKRTFLFIPTLIIVSLLAFGLSKVPEGDAVENCYDPSGEIDSKYNYDYAETLYQERAQTLGTDKPNFYFSLSSRAYPDTLYRIPRKKQRQNLEKLIAQYGNWTEIERYFNQIKKTEYAILEIPYPSHENNKIDALRAIRQLPIAYKENRINKHLEDLHRAIEKDSILVKKIGSQEKALSHSFDEIEKRSSLLPLYLPDFKWYGFDNQYHNWISKFIGGDFGIACIDNRPVGTKIKEAIYWTLIMNIIAIMMSYLIAIPLGVWSARRKGTRVDKTTSTVLFILHSLPVFWIGMMSLIFFATPDYGMQIFPGIGLGDSGANIPLWTRFWERATHLVLPILCMVYPSLAFLSRQMRGSMSEILQQDYIRTARAKGLKEQTVIWKHAFRNSLFPIITILASLFPRVLAGSIIIEVIFNIPGMGYLFFNSILAQDWNLVFTVLLLGAIMTMIGILVADVLYAWTDPRVSIED